MLSVINRGSVTGSEVDGLPYKIVYGYQTGAYNGLPLKIIKLSNIPTPFEINVEPTIKEGILPKAETRIMQDNEAYTIPITPVVKNGYTSVTIEPTRR